jgi:hypothetical protein
MKRGTIAIALALSLAPTAVAQKIPRAEQGSVPLAFDDFQHGSATVVVKPGETAWTESIRAANAVRLIDPVVERTRPKVGGVPAGTVLFGYRLSTGIAFCAPIDLAKVNRDVQCVRDLDGDGTFDGTYITNDRGADSRYFSSFLKSLTATKKARYEPASSADLAPAAARVVFTGLKNGAPRFNVFIDQDKMKEPFECRVQAPGVCQVLGVRFAYGPAEGSKDSVTLAFEGAAPNRKITLYDSTNHLDR